MHVVAMGFMKHGKFCPHHCACVNESETFSICSSLTAKTTEAGEFWKWKKWTFDETFDLSKQNEKLTAVNMCCWRELGRSI